MLFLEDDSDTDTSRLSEKRNVSASQSDSDTQLSLVQKPRNGISPKPVHVKSGNLNSQWHHCVSVLSISFKIPKMVKSVKCLLFLALI